MPGKRSPRSPRKSARISSSSAIARRGPLARWFGSICSYLVKRLRCSVLVAQTEISDAEFERLKPPAEDAAS